MAFTGNQRTEYMKVYNKNYYAQHKVVKSITDYSYTKEIISLLYGFALNERNVLINVDDNYFNPEPYGNKSYGSYSSKELYTRKQSGWSDLILIREEAIANYLQVSRKIIHNRIQKLIDNNIITIITYKKYNKNSYKPMSVIQVNLFKIETDNLYNKDYKKECINYYVFLSKQEDDKDKDKQKKMETFLAKHPFAGELRENFLQRQSDGTLKGARYFTDLCKTKNPENHEDLPLDRYYELDKLYGLDNLYYIHQYKQRYIEWDINGMSMRTNKNIINILKDQPLEDNDIDVYEVIYNLKFKKHINFKESEERKLLKVELQSMFQKLSSIYTKCDLYRNNINKEVIDDIETQELLQRAYKVEQVFGMPYDKFLNTLKYALYEYLRYEAENENIIERDGKKYTESKRLIIAKDYYFIEGIVYIEMENYFKQRNIKVEHVFDGWYGLRNEVTEEDFVKAYEYGVRTTVEKLGKDIIIKDYAKKQEYLVKSPIRLFKVNNKVSFHNPEVVEIVSNSYTLDELVQIKKRAKLEHF